MHRRTERFATCLCATALAAMIAAASGCARDATLRDQGPDGAGSDDANQAVTREQPAPPTDANARTADEGPRSESPTLIANFGRFLGDVAVQANSTGSLPKAARGPNYPLEVLKALRAQQPQIFFVTEDQEKRFARGDFPDARNSAEMDLMVRMLERAGDMLPWIPVAIVNLHQADKLDGVELELARRVMTVQLDRIFARKRLGDAE